jgi:mitochondrial fission protein ELM1
MALAEPRPKPERGDPDQPRVWLLLGDKRGDNAQVLAIEQALGWRCERKHLEMQEPWKVGKPRVTASLHHLDLTRSDPLKPPWPDLIITIGRRPSMVALWVAEQSGGRTRLVLVGKPSGKIERFDLVVVGAEAQMPPLDSVLRITLPLMRADEAAVTAAARAWAPRLADLPRPLVGILIGGPTGPFIYDRTVTDRLLGLVAEVLAQGGTPYVSTSRRTPPATIEGLAAGLPEGARLFRWTPDGPDNPYLALLGLADGLVVTGDSISMMVESIRLRRPLAIFDLPSSRVGALDHLRRSLAHLVFAPAVDAPPGSLRHRLALAAYRLGVVNYTRDFRAFYRMLLERGFAVPAGEPFAPPTAEVPDDLARVVARIRSLMEDAQARRLAGSGVP